MVVVPLMLMDGGGAIVTVALPVIGCEHTGFVPIEALTRLKVVVAVRFGVRILPSPLTSSTTV